jgi:cell wall-associated NlpC family hydrolase
MDSCSDKQIKSMKNSLLLFLLVFMIACATSKIPTESSSSSSLIQSHIEATRQQYAPDKRTALFMVKLNGDVLSGETNLSSAKSALLERLDAAKISYRDSIQVLPEEELENNHFAVVTVSVANLRSEPKHPAELATQATLGTPLKVWKKERGWYLVQTPDKYLAWVDIGGIKLMDSTQYAAWQQSPKVLYTQAFGFAYAEPDKQKATVSDLVYGDVLQLKNKSQDFYEAEFPDGRAAFIPVSEAMIYKEWTSSRQPTEENLVQTAKGLMGLPYLWGGTSVKGVDCSGFTKTVYFMNGLVLPRDASQQVHIGELIDIQNGWENLKPGDLLFFGTPAKGGKPERVVHVGMWIGGNQEFIHSASQVRVSSMNPAAPNYDDFELKRLLRVKRVSPEATLIDLRTDPVYEQAAK